MKRGITAVLVAAGAALVIACGGGGTSTTSETGTTTNGSGAAAEKEQAPTVATAPVGQALKMTRDFLGEETVVEITVSEVKTGVKSNNQFLKPEKGQFITAKVVVKAVKGKYHANPFSFKLVGADGAVFDPGLGVKEPNLGATELAAGQNVTGYITFDAAVGAEKGGKIALKDWASEGDAGYWGPLA